MEEQHEYELEVALQVRGTVLDFAVIVTPYAMASSRARFLPYLPLLAKV